MIDILYGNELRLRYACSRQRLPVPLVRPYRKGRNIQRNWSL